MFGLGDTFAYFRCVGCGCVQQLAPPADWSRYYPPEYHSFQVWNPASRGVRAAFAAARDRAHLRGRRWAGLLGQPKTCLQHVRGVGGLKLSRDARLLDVGCGAGVFLAVLHRAGFRRLLGVDPYIRGDLTVRPGVRVFKRELSEMDGEFDVIMFHHVLEHISDQHGAMENARRLLAPGGHVVIRVPTVESDAWDTYGERWVQLDAPRHVVLHSEKSLRIAAQRAGLDVESITRDSTGFQFWGSELYRRDVPLMGAGGTPTDPRRHFEKRELKSFEIAAEGLNAANRGDQLVAILTAAGRQD